MINETEDYIDQKLATFEIVLGRLLDQTQSGRENLRSMIAPRVDNQVNEQPYAPESVDSDDFMEQLRQDRPLTPQPAPAPINWGEPAQAYRAPAVTNDSAQGWDDEFFFDQGQI